MIGGIDTDLPTMAGEYSLEVAVRAVRQHWPNCVFENPETAEHYEFFWQIPFGSIQEIFVYRDADASQGWDTEGAIPELYNTMVHILAAVETVTIVVDEMNPEMKGLIDDVSSALSDEIFYVSANAESEAA